MKLFYALTSLAAAQRGFQPADRIWNPDVDVKIAETLTVDSLTDSWTLPVDGSGKYEPNKYYRVTVNGPEGHKIRADFSNFRLEGFGFSGTCTNDKVDIFDGTDGNNLITTYCGKGARDSVKSTGTTLTVVFKSNENGILDTGFDVTFTAEALPVEDNNWNAVTSHYEQLYLAIYNKYGEFGNAEKQANKAARFTLTMTKFYQFELKERTIAGCTKFARSGDPDHFVAPVFDADDLCASLDSFFLAVKSYHDAYACIAGTDYALKHLRPHVIENVIQRQRFKLFTLKFTELNCEHTLGHLPTLDGF
ncbi:unnamed protein product [Oikopleura dioica]|uniref:CUB domain-containing protein n=1 Tax=Oikopleura dioica TaxID=34765 RepID=E4X680_OIKDI|nr:unnamed protein product [Oikopleura dioica]